MIPLGDVTQRMVLLAEGRLSSIGLRMVIAALLYIPERVVAVIDSTKSQVSTSEAIGFGGDTPIVDTVAAAMSHQPDSLLIGITPLGGALPEGWRIIIREAIQAGLNIVSGLLQPLTSDPEFVALADAHGVDLIDLRKIPNSHLIRAQGSWRMRTVNTILTVGTDSNTGKMTTALLIHREMKRRGFNAALVGTGMTGMLIGSRGVMLENVASDFIIGALELEIDKAANDGCDPIIVEGHGAITNCGNSSIALGILHGTMPDAMVLCHQPSRDVDCYGLPLPLVHHSIKLHEDLMMHFKASRVVGIGLNSMGLNKVELAIQKAELLKSADLTAVDPLREGAGPLVDALLKHFESYNRNSLPTDSVYINDRI
jgi:uncharacterized NAD-dependent epimerase/dehydratase family protein